MSYLIFIVLILLKISKINYFLTKCCKKVELYEDIAIDFFDKIIKMNYYECFISDYTTLFDFSLDDEQVVEKIKNIYGIEPYSDLVLANIFDK